MWWHRGYRSPQLYPFRGVVVDVDPEFDNTDEWYDPFLQRCGPTRHSLSTICWQKTLKAITPPMSASRTLFLTVWAD